MLETPVEQARRLSSGTIATLTGETRYDKIEAIQQDFVKHVEAWVEVGLVGPKAVWQSLWKLYKEVAG